MGISLSSAYFLIGEMRRGVDFSKTLTLGRQGVYMQRDHYKVVCSLLNVEATRIATYADELFAGLGAKSLDVLDASSYEGAGFTHDLNKPLTATPSRKWSCVIDGGTLEHVFNFPEAIKTCMELVEQGGHLILITPWNNWAGHGFYQFSPELFYRIFCAQNGFRLERLLIYRDNKWFSILDPKDLGERIEDISPKQTELFVSAKKIDSASFFLEWPQQSDYVTAWGGAPNGKADPQTIPRRLKARLLDVMPMLSYFHTFWRFLKKGHEQKRRFASWAKSVPQEHGIPL